MPPTQSLTIRPATHRDRSALWRLAALDSAPAPAGDVFVAEVDGVVVAAAGDRRAVADPFRRTDRIVSALAAYAS